MQTTRGTSLTDGADDGLGAETAAATTTGASTAGASSTGAITTGASPADASPADAPPLDAPPLGAPSSGASPTGGQPRVRLVVLLAVVVIAVDQISKAVAVDQLTGREPIRLLGGALTLNLAYNSGAAFSFAQGFTVVFSLVAFIVAVVIIRVARQLVSSWWAVALGLLLGGALGNLTDRLFRPPGPLKGHVVDFLQLPHWPIFNLADSAIVCAGALMVLLTFRGVQLDGSRANG